MQPSPDYSIFGPTYIGGRAVFVRFPRGRSEFWVLTSGPGPWYEHLVGRSLTVLEFASGRVDGWIKIPSSCLCISEGGSYHKLKWVIFLDP